MADFVLGRCGRFFGFSRVFNFGMYPMLKDADSLGPVSRAFAAELSRALILELPRVFAEVS